MKSKVSQKKRKRKEANCYNTFSRETIIDNIVVANINSIWQNVVSLINIISSGSHLRSALSVRNAIYTRCLDIIVSGGCWLWWYAMWSTSGRLTRREMSKRLKYLTMLAWNTDARVPNIMVIFLSKWRSCVFCLSTHDRIAWFACNHIFSALNTIVMD